MIKKLFNLFFKDFINLIKLKFTKNISDYKRRSLRAHLLKKFSIKLENIIKRTGFNQGVYITSKGIYVESNGIFLNTKGTNRYFKVPGDRQNGNEAYEMNKFLVAHPPPPPPTTPKIIFDVGANYGEISMFFSKQYPNCKIFSIEPSTDNIKIFNDNIQSQQFSTSNITLIPKAVADYNGTIEITRGASSEAQVILNPNDKYENTNYSKLGSVKVPCTTLSNIIINNKVDYIDFMKIDIEGSEPLLKEDLQSYASKINIICIEFSYKNDSDKYLDLMNTLYSSGFTAYLREDANVSLTLEQANDQYIKVLEKGAGVIDYYFIKQ
jgi:FkbM family methyltransferase